MKKLLGWMLHPVLWLLVGAACLALLVWFGGPFLAIADWHPLDSEVARIVLIIVLLALWLGRRAWHAVRARLANRRLIESIAADSKATDAQSPAHNDVMQQRFVEAMTTLRDRRFGERPSLWSRLAGTGARRYLYQLPWYVFIGAPGSGKTTALLNSGLQFSLSDRLGAGPVAGVGGTRNCDWWFTDEAVLIDTAGRYTTQDSQQAVDAAEWRDFLHLLKRHRPRQPLNGVLVTVSVADLLQASEPERERHADAVHERLQELVRTLGTGLPVYLLVTKTDLLAGFTESFEPLDREQRDQVWGFTFDWNGLPGTGAFDAARFSTEFDRLLQRLSDQTLDRVHAERDLRRRALVQGFPWQLGALRPALGAFAARAFAPSKLGNTPIVRGVFFSSGTQEGSPIDRVLGSIARSLGLQGRMLDPLRPSGRSYFLRGLLEGLVFREAPLAGTNLAWERHMSRLKWGAAVGCLLLGVAAAAAWTTSYLNNASYVSQVEKRANELAKALQQRAGGGAGLREQLAIFDDVRGLARTASVPDPSVPPPGYGLGLFQGEKLDAAAQQAYRRVLQDALAPALAARLEQALQLPSATPEFRYETLKTYLMLSAPDRLDREAVREWVALSASLEGPGALPPPDRERLLVHTDAMLAASGTITPPPRNDRLVEQARAALARTPLPQRVYDRLKRQDVGSDQQAFRITTAAGPSAAVVFARASGKPITDGVPGVYTHDGYHKSFSKALPQLVKSLAQEEVWVLGITDSEHARRAADTRGQDSLVVEVKRLYLQDYAGIWEQFVSDIRLVPITSLAQSIQTARVLSGPDSPLPRLIRAVVREVTLTDGIDPAKAAQAAANNATGAAAQARQNLTKLLGRDPVQSAISAAPAAPESIVDDRFDALRRLVRAPAPGQPAPIDQTLGLIDELYKLLNATEAAVQGGAAAPSAPEMSRIQAEAARLPEPVKSMVLALAKSGAGQASRVQREQLSGAMKATVGEPCMRATSKRYPFTPGASNDVPPGDFAKLFGPGGTMDAFFQKELAPIVDTTQKPWRLRGEAGESTAPAQFQRAAEIRDAFFSADAKVPSIRAQIRVLDMDSDIQQLTIDVDGQPVVFTASTGPGGAAPQLLQWPGARGGAQIRIVATTAGGPGRPMVFEGPWAPLRLVDAAQLEPSAAPERLRASLMVDGRKVRLELVSSSMLNPLRLPEIRAFRCPLQL